MGSYKSKGKQDYGLSTEVKAKHALSEGRQELDDALKYMDQIKNKVGKWHGNTKEFFEEVTSEYDAKARKMEKSSGDLTTYDKFKAFCSTLPVLASKQDPTKKRLGKMLDTLVNDAEGIYSNLNGKIGDYESNFEDVDDLFDDLIGDSKKYMDIILEQDGFKKQYTDELADLETKIEAGGRQAKDYLDLKKDIIATKRQLENASRQRSSALNKYNNALNMLDALESLRDESVTMLSEGKNLYETLENSVESLKPLFDQVSSAADLAEFQVKALEAHDMLKDTFNPAMIAITAVAKGVSKVATERIGENFIEDKTIETVKALSYEHQGEMDKRREREDAMIEDILNKADKPKQIEDGSVMDLEKDEEGNYAVEKDEE